MAYRNDIKCEAKEAEKDADVDEVCCFFAGNGHRLHDHSNCVSMGIGAGIVVDFDHVLFCLLLGGGTFRFTHKDIQAQRGERQ